MSGKGKGISRKGGRRDEPGPSDDVATNKKCGVGKPRGVVG